MKLMVGRQVRQVGFALPTILLVSTVMLAILVASIAAAAASRVALDSQYYNQLAQQAVESGMARANQCLQENGYAPQWSTNAANRDLRPNTDCTGARVLSNPYVMDGTANVRTSYSIEAPEGSGPGSSLRVVGVTELTRSSSPGSVWRRYQQVSYLHIEPRQMVACPEGFVAVPGDERFSTNDFCVGKYEAKNVGGRAVSQAEGAPWVDINQTDATAAASNACAGCSLVSEAQWLTMAHNALSVSSNWSGGSVGDGYIYSGHNDNAPANSLAAASDDSDGYAGTGDASGNQRRTLRLSNGEVVWDIAGNVAEWTSGRTSGGQPGSRSSAHYAWFEWNTIEGTGNLSPSPFPSFGTPAASGWTHATHGIGAAYTSSNDMVEVSFLRGGGWNYGANGWSAGIFTLYAYEPHLSFSNIGFRVAFDPLSQVQCPDGHIPVPGNSQFGTSNFCVGKYEAKNVGGVARSQAAGTPWVNISQTGAATAANAACAKCRLIGEAEWLTIAHNVTNVASNWTGGSVGSGTIYRGHSDNAPAGALAASTDDNLGYTSTGDVSPSNQRRTLTLNNGSVIWDFSGNVWEWTSGQIASNQPGAVGWGWREWNTIGSTTLVPNPLPSFGTPAAAGWNSTHGMGRLYSSSNYTSLRAFLRSGNWSDPSGYGMFTLALNRGPNDAAADAGFRMVGSP